MIVVRVRVSYEYLVESEHVSLVEDLVADLVRAPSYGRYGVSMIQGSEECGRFTVELVDASGRVESRA